MEQKHHDSHLFTLRLWPEPLAGGGMGWRGQLTHVLSGETSYFREWWRLVEFLSSVLADRSAAPIDRQIMSHHTLTTLGGSHVDEEYMQRHCLMVSVDASEGVEGSATIWYLDWLDAQGVPHSQVVASQYAGFRLLGDDGWKLVQVIEHPAAEGGSDGPIPADTTYYFTRSARSKG
jgi:hypothetical protein